MFKTYKDKKTIKSLGKNPQNVILKLKRNVIFSKNLSNLRKN